MTKLKIRWRVDVALSEALWDEVNRACVEYLRNSNLILDIGCGSSAVLRGLPNDHIVGVDIKREYLADSIYENRVVASAYCLPFREQIFDGTHCRAIIHHLEVSKFLEELSAVCQPGGHACIVEPLQGLITRPIRWLITTDYHETGEKPLGRAELEEIHKHIKIKTLKYPFGEFAYLLIFMLPALPKLMREFLRIPSYEIVRMQKRFPLAPIYILMLGSIR